MSDRGWFCHDYRIFRPPVPDVVTRRVVDTLDRRGRALDVGCGTGQWTFGLARHVEEVVGADPDPGMVAEAERASIEVGAAIRFVRADAPDLDGVNGPFDLVGFCRSFHWLDRRATLERLRALSTPATRVAVIGDGSLWTGRSEWQTSLRDLVQSYLGPERRAGTGTYEAPRTSHQEELAAAGFPVLVDERLPFDRKWTVEAVLGYLRSTSYARPDLFADHAAFERDATGLLDARMPLVENGGFSVIVAGGSGSAPAAG